MKKNLYSLFTLIFLLLSSFHTQAQIINTYAGDNILGYAGDGGPATAAEFYSPAGITFDHAGNAFICDQQNNVIRKITPDGIITTFAGVDTMGYSGDGGPATAAKLYTPFAVAFDGSGNTYIADTRNNVIRMVNSAGIISTFAGNHTMGYFGDGGPATAATLNQPAGLAFDSSHNLYISEYGNNVIRMVNAHDTISAYAGSHALGAGYSGDGGAATAARLNMPWGLAFDRFNNLYIADNINNVIRKVSRAGIITTFAGGLAAGYGGDSAAATAALLNKPSGVVADDTGNVYIADQYNQVIRRVDTSGMITTYAGSFDFGAGYNGDGGYATDAQLDIPAAVAFDNSGNFYIADEGNYVIRIITPGMLVSGVHSLPGTAGSLKIFPNPGEGVFTINITSNIREQAQVTVTNAAGETVKELTITTNTVTALKLEVPAGIYFINAVTSHGKWQGKVVITPQ